MEGKGWEKGGKEENRGGEDRKGRESRKGKKEDSTVMGVKEC